ncbi:MAG: protein translocase subunit SecF [Chloroflexia bacterium]
MIDLVGKRYIFILISLIIIVPGVIVLITPGLGLRTGIDFTGGLRWEVRPAGAEADSTEKFKGALAAAGYGDALVKGGTLTNNGVTTQTIIMDLPRIAGMDTQAQQTEKDKIAEALITRDLVKGSFVTDTITVPSTVTSTLTPGATVTSTAQITTTRAAATSTVGATGTVTSTGSVTGTTGTTGTGATTKILRHYRIDPASEIQLQSIGPTVGRELFSRAIFAILAASAVILIYLTIVFRRVPNAFRYGVCAIIALLHDVLVVVGVFAILGQLFFVEIDALFVTAMLTVIGFSVHDTIVVFDRVRENIMRRRFERFDETVNYSLVQTLARSINTSVTVLLTLFALYMFGGASIHTFVLALLIGIISGTYSSIFNASMLLVIWEKREWRTWFGRGGAGGAPAGTPERPRGAVAR